MTKRYIFIYAFSKISVINQATSFKICCFYYTYFVVVAKWVLFSNLNKNYLKVVLANFDY